MIGGEKRILSSLQPQTAPPTTIHALRCSLLYLTPLDVRDVVHSSCPPPPGAGGGCSRRLIARTAAQDDQRSKFRSQQKQSSPPRRFRDQAPRPRSLSSKRHSSFKKGKTIEGGGKSVIPTLFPIPVSDSNLFDALLHGKIGRGGTRGIPTPLPITHCDP